MHNQAAAARELQALLAEQVRDHGNYQVVPEVVLRHFSAAEQPLYRQEQLALDAPRFTWLRDHLDCTGMVAVEIGANLGYFSIRLADSCGATVHAYEPIAAYAKAVNLMAQVIGLGARVHGHAEPVPLEKVAALPACDLMVSLNVLHHAGRSFATDVVRDENSWREYARRYLSACAGRAKWLFFQTGSTMGGSALFPSADAVPFTAKLLEDSGWSVVQTGVIADFSALTYASFSRAELDRVPRTSCRRDPATGLVAYTRDGKQVAALPTGLAQRPLWLCRAQ